jgi:hypothetical protein
MHGLPDSFEYAGETYPKKASSWNTPLDRFVIEDSLLEEHQRDLEADIDGLNERPRCELDVIGGGVCQRLLLNVVYGEDGLFEDGTCNNPNHTPDYDDLRERLQAAPEPDAKEEHTCITKKADGFCYDED